MDFNIINISSIGSTNSHAKELIGGGRLTEGDIILTHNQNDGQGLGDNSWESEANNNVTLSLILQPTFIEPSKQFVLTQIISLSIIDTIGKYLDSAGKDLKLKIKWPNDIYIDNGKVAGILFQNFVLGNQISYSIAGIGININQEVFTSCAKNPTSLIHHIANAISVDDFLGFLLRNINSRYELFKSNKDFTGLQREYLDSLYRYNKWDKYLADGSKFLGKIIDVDGYGRLIVENQDTTNTSFMFKEIEFVL